MNTYKEKISSLADEIMRLSHDDILMHLRFFDRALAALRLQARPGTGYFATDGQFCFYDPVQVLKCCRENPALITRSYLHMLLHCIFSHHFQYDRLDGRYWDLAADIAVENVILELGIAGAALEQDGQQTQRLEELKVRVGSLTAERLYRCLIGNTAIVEQVAQELGIALVSYSMTHHTRQSALGLPFIAERVYGGETYSISEYTMSEIIAAVYDTMEAGGIKEGILFLDEINCVSETLSPAMLQFLQYKTFGRHRVPQGWVIVTAGNPPEYNRSVREFDVVTYDRLKVMEVEPDYAVWKEYAAERQIHNAVTGYLDLKTEHFYRMEMTAKGRSYVTARGWEDLSEILKLYEEEQLPVDETLVGQYLRNTEVVKEFTAYYDLYQKYKSEYRIGDILNGRASARTMEKARDAAFDERLSLLGMLLDRVQADMREDMEQAAVLADLKNPMKGMAALARQEDGGSGPVLERLGILAEARRKHGFEGHASRIELPPQIEGCPVAVIERKAFLSRKGLHAVALPDTTEEIGDWAFACCDNLTEISLPGRDVRFGRAVFKNCGKLKRIVARQQERTPELPSEQQNQASELPATCLNQTMELPKGYQEHAPELLAAAVTMLDTYYLLDLPAAGSREWLGKWDARLTSAMHTAGQEGYISQSVYGEEDYIGTGLDEYVSARRKEKARLAFVRLLHPHALQPALKEELEQYLRSLTKGREGEEAWQVLRDEHGEDREYYSLFAEISCVTEENLEGILAGIGEEYPEMKAFFLTLDKPGGDGDFFAGLEL